MPKFRFLLCISLLVLVALAPAALAQVTTGNIAGTVTARQDNSAMPGVTIEAVHIPTGTRYAGVTGANGRYEIPNVRVGGPYRITANLEGFKSTTAEGVQVRLGEFAEVPLTLQLATVSEAITVTAQTDPIINPGHMGATSDVTTAQIQSLPTVNRSLQDFARTNPYFVIDPTDSTGTYLTVAGRNNRYNNIQIDGAVNNDLFGLQSTGTPGGQTGEQPISLDAIQQLQLLVSPYDVRQSGFTGGGINAVTRSGTNKFEGSAFGTKRNKSYIGKGPLNAPVSQFNQTQWGGRFGGPILQDRLFFFVSGEQNRFTQPNGWSADGSTPLVYGGSGTGSQPSAAELASFLKSKYNYDPGSLGDLIYKQPNDLLFARLDFNLNNSNNITLRHNYVTGSAPSDPNCCTRSTDQFFFPTSIYNFADKTHSTVAQIDSVLSPNAYNEGRIGYQTIRDARTTPVIFPTVEIGGSGSRSGAIQVGTERFSGANALNQDILELTDDYTWVKGNHTIIFGTHNEWFKFKNLFIQDSYGYYYFPTLDAFEAGTTPSLYSIGYAVGSTNPRNPTAFNAGQYSLYANDQWRVAKGLTLTAGLRADKPHFSTKPSFNPAVQTAFGRSTASAPSESITWEPRVGFNWDPRADGKQQLRGGVGMFQGRTPYVWISNAYGNTGVTGAVVATCDPSNGCTPPAFNPDPNAQPRNLGSASAIQVALTDPNFKFPRVLRSTLGYDRDIIWGIRGTAEVLYSKTQDDIFYYHVNEVQNGTSPLDGRPTYTRISSQFINGPILLSNTHLGREITETLQLNKTFRNVTLTTSYAHQNAKGAAEGQSSIAFSGWRFNQLTRGDIFHPELGTSAYQIKDRFNIAATYNLSTGLFSHAFGVYYNAQTGFPYSLLMDGDPNRDGNSFNDLLYVPPAGALILCPSNAKSPTATAPCSAGVSPIDVSRFTTFLSTVGLNPTSGQTLARNVVTAPWSHNLDFHYELGLPQYRTARVLVTADILNLINLFDRNAGVKYYVNHQTYTPVRYQGQDAASGKAIYREELPGALNPGHQLFLADTSSRWQGRLGLRVNF